MDLKKGKLKYIVSDESTIEEAWSIIEGNDHRSVIVLKDGRVVGTLSDGDLRKAMLAKRLLSTPVSDVMNINFIYLTEGKEKIGRKMFEERNHLFIIPVVDKKMKLIDVLER